MHSTFNQKKTTPTTWFTNKPVGHHTLRNTRSRLCRTAGISGYKSNHSLRATAATRLYQSGVDELLVMVQTWHRSLEGIICSYRRTSDVQRKAVSDVLHSKRPCTEGNLYVFPLIPLLTSGKIIQLNEYGCRDAPCKKSWKQGYPLSNTIKDTSTIMRNPLPELCREGLRMIVLVSLVVLLRG